MAIRKPIGNQIREDLEQRGLTGKAGMRKCSVFLSEETIRDMLLELPGLSVSTAIRFMVEQYLKDHR